MATLKGERDPEVLAKMRDPRIKASAQTIAAASEGNYRLEHLFNLGQSLQGYRQRQELIAACEREIEQYLVQLDSRVDVAAAPLPEPKDRHKPRRNEMTFDLRSQLYRIYGGEQNTDHLLAYVALTMNLGCRSHVLSLPKPFYTLEAA
jgi:transposase